MMMMMMMMLLLLTMKPRHLARAAGSPWPRVAAGRGRRGGTMQA